ncbi:MAG: LysM peptidoglycan-binding domain-containing protein [Paracoccaceae bacterium]
MPPGQIRTATLAAAIALGASGTPAAAEDACEHVVAAGETLGGIAEDRLGDSDPAPILALNPGRLDDPDRIRPGEVLRLPCPDDRATPATPAPAPEPASPRRPAGPAPAETVRAVFGGDAAGLVAAEGLRDLVAGALAEVGAAASSDDPAAAVDAAAALAATGPEGPSHLSYPWIRPDCGRLHRLPPDLARRCATLDFSAPLATLDVVWIARPGGPAAAATGSDRLRGLTLCRPSGTFDGDLAAAGLAPPRARRVAAPDAAACLAAVADGRADVASLPAHAASAAMEARPPDAPALTANPALASSVTLHAAARRDSPAGRAGLAALDVGLARLEAATPDDPVREP